MKTTLKISAYTILRNIYLKLDNHLSVFHRYKTDVTKLTRKFAKRNAHFCELFGGLKS